MQARTDAESVVLLKQKSMSPVINYYKKSYEQVSEMLHRKRTVRGSKGTNKIKIGKSKPPEQEKDLRIEETLSFKRQPEEKQQKHKKKRAKLGTTRSSLKGVLQIKNLIQRAIETNEDYGLPPQLLLYPHYPDKQHPQRQHHQHQPLVTNNQPRAYQKQLRKVHQQQMQNALIVRNITTLKKDLELSDDSDNSDLEQLPIKENDEQSIEKIKKQADLKPLITHQSLSSLGVQGKSAEVHRHLYASSTDTDVFHSSQENGALGNTLKKNILIQPNGLPEIHQQASNQLLDDQLCSPYYLSTTGKRGNELQYSQEYGVKSYTDLEQQHNLQTASRTSLHQNYSNSFKTSKLGRQASQYGSLLNTGKAGQLDHCQALPNIVNQQLAVQMNTLDNGKNKSDLLKKSIMDHQMMDGTWVIEQQPQQKGLSDIIIQGQSLPSHIVMGGHLMQTKRKANIGSAKGSQRFAKKLPTSNEQHAQVKNKLKDFKNKEEATQKEKVIKLQPKKDPTPAKASKLPNTEEKSNDANACAGPIIPKQPQDCKAIGVVSKKNQVIVEKTIKQEEICEENQQDVPKANVEELQLQQAKTTFQFRPRKPLINPAEVARQEQERLIQMKNEAKEKYRQFSLLNKQNNQKHKYLIMPGNNSGLVKKCMELRSERWEETVASDTLFNFKWTPLSKGIKFDFVNTYGTRQLVNHFENHDIITTKNQLFKNLFTYYESRKLNVFDVVPVTFLLEVDSQNYVHELDKFITYFAYTEKLLQSKPLQLLQQDKGLKDTILSNINSKFQNHQMTKEEKGPLFTKRKIPSSHFQGQNIWVLKATGFNRGIGIHVFNKLEDLKRLIKEYTDGIILDFQQAHSVNSSKILSKETAKNTQKETQSISNVENVPSYLKSTSFVIQKYLEDPLLINKRKFDIRVWVLVNQEQKCFLFKEGYVRTSSEEFSLSQDSITKPYIHLTNNAIQKNAESYGKFEEGNQMSFNDLQASLDQEAIHDRPNYVKEDLIPKMKEIIVDSFEAVKKKLKTGKNCLFELFGYDFILDNELGAWLIEVNTNPCLEESSQLLQSYIPRMINDMLKLTVDQAFPARKGQAIYPNEQLNKFPIEGYPIDENMWELICQIDPASGSQGGQGSDARNSSVMFNIKK